MLHLAKINVKQLKYYDADLFISHSFRRKNGNFSCSYGRCSVDFQIKGPYKIAHIVDALHLQYCPR